MDDIIKIAKITRSMVESGGTHIPISEYLASGFNLLTKRYKDSGYGDSNFLDISIPAPLERDTQATETPSDPPIVNLLAIKDGEAVAQLCIFDAHETTPIDNEDKFQPILSIFRKKNRGKDMLYFGRMASHEDYANDMRLIGGLMHTGAIFALERECSMTIAVVNPKHARFYHNVFGFNELGRVNCMSGMKDAPGVLLYVTPAMLKKDKLNRLGKAMMGLS